MVLQAVWLGVAHAERQEAEALPNLRTQRLRFLRGRDSRVDMEGMKTFLASYGLTLSVQDGHAVIEGEYENVRRLILLLEMIGGEDNDILASGEAQEDESNG